jgi:MarR family transcriptional repressor of emrRAB
MASTDSPVDQMEANLRALSTRVPDLPITEIVLNGLLIHLARQIATGFEQRLRPFGLAEAEFRVLTMLFSQPDGVTHPSDLGVRAGQSAANISRIGDALVSRDLITRVLSAHDRRRMVLRITEQGEDLVRRLLPKLFGSLRAMYAEFSESELQLLIAQLKRLLAKAEEAGKTLPEDAP